MITTDYTKAANPQTLEGGALTSYRTLYWLKGVLQNFMSDPINIKDERISWMFNFQDGEAATKIDGLFEVDVAYSDRTNTACRTPMVFISLGPRSYPVRGINAIGSPPVASCGTIPMHMGRKYKMIPLTITVETEKYASTVALTDLIEDFLLINEDTFKLDNHSISEFHVTGVSEPQFQQVNTGSQAKCIYSQVIQLYVVGGISWTTDTQGPVYRGITQKVKIK